MIRKLFVAATAIAALAAAACTPKAPEAPAQPPVEETTSPTTTGDQAVPGEESTPQDETAQAGTAETQASGGAPAAPEKK
ncbi:MAG: hypothetical protein K1X35_06785 [Caulobacteraceae bacterium]|nr:hypothetical protein [Caulobacteraceae bacterium]